MKPTFETEAETAAYARGFNHGHGVACHNVPTLGEKIFSESLGRCIVDAENIREVHQASCYEAEGNSRSYSPFEHTAYEFNSAGEDESEALWEAFERGTSDAIEADLATYTDEDYGVERNLPTDLERIAAEDDDCDRCQLLGCCAGSVCGLRPATNPHKGGA
jgi:hypothetical protein